MKLLNQISLARDKPMTAAEAITAAAATDEGIAGLFEMLARNAGASDAMVWLMSEANYRDHTVFLLQSTIERAMNTRAYIRKSQPVTLREPADTHDRISVVLCVIWSAPTETLPLHSQHGQGQ